MITRQIESITKKVIEDNKYLTIDDAVVLFSATSDSELEIIRFAADEVRKRLNGDQVSYTINLNVNFTNICDSACLFCGFRRSETDKDAYILNIDELSDKLKDLVKKGGLEVCFQGGLNPRLDIPGLKAKNLLDNYAKLLLWVKDKFPGIITHAYSPEEIDFLSIMTDKPIHYLLEYLKDCGLDTMPGTAAEVLVDEVRKKVCPKKLSTARWVEIIKYAHKISIPTTCTIMYGHFDNISDRAEHLNVLRALQLETGGFTEFIPLPLIATRTALSKVVKPLVAEERLKMLAISRLFFVDLIPNIQASWVKQGMEETRESLNWGVNDVGGTLGDERITYEAGGEFGRAMEADDLVKLICSENRKAVLRDTYYNHVFANICVTT